MSIQLALFTLLGLLMAVATCVVTFSRNLMYSAFALLGTLFGTAVLFGLLSADFVAVTQLLVYVGGILILILFAVMLTSEIAETKVSNRSVGVKFAAPLVAAVFLMMVALLGDVEWAGQGTQGYTSSVHAIGNALLTDYLLPFEVISLLLLTALVGAVVLVRREVR